MLRCSALVLPDRLPFHSSAAVFVPSHHQLVHEPQYLCVGHGIMSNRHLWVIGGLFVVIAGVVWIGGVHCHAKPVGIHAADFPDKEVCSLACGVGWDTYVNANAQFDSQHWYAKPGDMIEWVIDKQASGMYRCDGLYFIGSGIKELEMKLNYSPIIGELKDGNYTLIEDVCVIAGDVIAVKIISINGDGLVRSIQPTGVH